MSKRNAALEALSKDEACLRTKYRGIQNRTASRNRYLMEDPAEPAAPAIPLAKMPETLRQWLIRPRARCFICRRRPNESSRKLRSTRIARNTTFTSKLYVSTLSARVTRAFYSCIAAY